MKNLETDTIQCIAVCDAFLKLFSENTSTFLNFFFRQRLSLKVLEFCFCKELPDDSLKQIMFCCRNLRSLCIRRCQNVGDEFLKSIFDICPYLRSLILNGTMIRSGMLKEVNWSRCLLVELDLSWCRHITEEGLLYTLPALNRFLRYLHVSCCGHGHALTAKVLRVMGQKCWRSLTEGLMVSY